MYLSPARSNFANRIAISAHSAILVALAITLLVVAEGLMMPLVLAVFVWYMVHVSVDLVAGVHVRGKSLPRAAAATVSLMTLSLLVGGLIWITIDAATAIAQAAPRYQERLQDLAQATSQALGIPKPLSLGVLLDQIDLGYTARAVLNATTNLVGSTGLVLVYLLFLFWEQKSFAGKLRFLSGHDPDRIRSLLVRIDHDIRSYLVLKTLTSLLTGALTWIVLAIIGLDFAAFWGVTAFVLNFIPAIGLILSVIPPTLLALVQFESLLSVIMVLVGLLVAQTAVGNLLEPRWMGKGLNLSPLVVLISLAFWGTVWGIPGAVLSVPLTVIVVIVMGSFPRTRPLAVLLTADGELHDDSKV